MSILSFYNSSNVSEWIEKFSKINIRNVSDIPLTFTFQIDTEDWRGGTHPQMRLTAHTSLKTLPAERQNLPSNPPRSRLRSELIQFQVFFARI